MADTDLTPYDMGTFGSRTTPLMAPQMKKVGAAAREALIDLAAGKWKVDRASISSGRRQGEEQRERRIRRVRRIDARPET